MTKSINPLIPDFHRFPDFQKSNPSLIQLWIGCGVALLHAKDHLEAASILVKAKKHAQGYSSMISAVEELGKINLYTKCLKIDATDRSNAWASVRDALKDHRKKLQAFLDAVSYFYNKERKGEGWSIKVNVRHTGDPIDEFAAWAKEAYVNKSLPHLIHSLRLDLSYSTISNDRVYSPARAANRISVHVLEAFVEIIEGFVTMLIKMMSLLGPIENQLNALYNSGSDTEEQTAYGAVASSLERLLPAFLTLLKHKIEEIAGRKINIFSDNSFLTEIKFAAGCINFKVLTEETLRLAASDVQLDPDIIKALGL